MLLVVGALDMNRPTGSAAKELRVVELGNNGREAKRLLGAAAASRHRSVYLPLLRGLVPASLEAFDFAEQGMVTGNRDTTTVATQSLYLLNDPFVRRQARELADHLLQPGGLGDEARVQWAYRLALCRPASAAEVERVRIFLADYESAARSIVWQPPVAAEAASPEPAAAQSADKTEAAEQPAESPLETMDPRLAAWAAFCQSLLGCAEFRYLK
jgi:hypothetical protein